MNILITGGLGHIGSYLCRELEDNITIVDNLSTQRYCSLFDLPKNVTFIEGNFQDIDTELIAGQDIVIHLAAITDASSSFDIQEKITQLNITDTCTFLDKVTRLNKYIIFPSSTSVYGSNEDIMYESSSTLNPQSPYAASKIFVENYLRNYMNCVIFRFGTIFGVSPGMRFHTAINKFCYQARFNQPLTVWKDNIRMQRPYLGLIDMSQAIELAINKRITGIYNVLTNNYTLESIINSIRSRVPDIRINKVSTPLLNQYSYVVNFDKIKNLGYDPVDNVEVQIHLTLSKLGL